MMRSDEMREDSTFKRHGIRLTSQELVAAKQGGPGRHLWARSLLRSIGYKRFNFETSAPGLPGNYFQCIVLFALLSQHSRYGEYHIV